MVHHVKCIDAELHDLRFRDMERFAEVPVDTRQGRPAHYELTKSTATPGQGILQQDLSGVCIGYCLERAQRRESRWKRRALRISDDLVLREIEVAAIDLACGSGHGSPSNAG